MLWSCRTKKKENSWVSTVMKNVNNSRIISSTSVKLDIQVVSNPLNNFQLVIKVELLELKCSNYALKLQNGKKENSWISNVMKNTNNSRTINCTFVKLDVQVVSIPLNNFQLVIKVDLLELKCSNYALKL